MRRVVEKAERYSVFLERFVGVGLKGTDNLEAHYSLVHVALERFVLMNDLDFEPRHVRVIMSSQNANELEELTCNCSVL
jgi:hypothetical protein